MLKLGDPFPKFSLLNQDGAEISNSDLAGNSTVVYFYPKDDTSGCTAEACGLQESAPELGDVKVIGVSPDPVKSHKKFADKYGLKFTLLADTEKELCTACGIWVEKSMYGKKYMGVERTTYLVDKEGKISHIWNKVKPQGHEKEILSVINSD